MEIQESTTILAVSLMIYAAFYFLTNPMLPRESKKFTRSYIRLFERVFGLYPGAPFFRLRSIFASAVLSLFWLMIFLLISQISVDFFHFKSEIGDFLGVDGSVYFYLPERIENDYVYSVSTGDFLLPLMILVLISSIVFDYLSVRQSYAFGLYCRNRATWYAFPLLILDFLASLVLGLVSILFVSALSFLLLAAEPALVFLSYVSENIELIQRASEAEVDSSSAAEGETISFGVNLDRFWPAIFLFGPHLLFRVDLLLYYGFPAPVIASTLWTSLWFLVFVILRLLYALSMFLSNREGHSIVVDEEKEKESRYIFCGFMVLLVWLILFFLNALLVVVLTPPSS